MNLQQLQYFKTVAESGQVTKAAQLLHTSQPTLSMSIAALERELNVELFQKKGRFLQLTDCGRVFLTHVSNALSEIELGRQKIEQIALTDKSTIRIASTYSLSLSLIPTLVKNFTSQHPNTLFHLKQGPNLELLEDLTSGRTDFVLGRAFSENSKYKGIKSLCLYSEKLVILINKDHPLAVKDELSLSDIEHEDFIFFHESTGYQMIVTALFQTLGSKPHIRYEVYDNSTCAALVATNQGIALVAPSATYDRSTSKQIALNVPIDFKQPEVCLCYQDKELEQRPPLHQAFLKYVQSFDFIASLM